MAEINSINTSSRPINEKAKTLKLMLYKRRRNLAQAFQFEMTMRLSINLIPVERSLWKKKRSTAFWYETVKENWEEDDCISNFRMTSQAFEGICTKLSPEY